MKKIFLAIFGTVLTTLSLHAQTYVLDKTIALTGDAGYDYVSIDMPNNRLYVSHGSMLNIVDLVTEKQIAVIGDMQGIHGVAIAPKSNRAFISDGRANAVVAFDLTTLQKVATIPVTGKGPDGIIYDSFSDRVYCINGDSNDISVIDPSTLKQVGSIDLGGAPEFAVSDGKGKVYNNLEEKNIVNVIDAKTLKVINKYPIAPAGGPTGITLDDADNRIFTVCRQNKGMSVLDAITGKIIATVPIGGGVDAVCYDPATKLIFCSCGDGTTTIIKQNSADDYSVVQTLKTPVRAKTMALDTRSHKIYLSVADFEPGTRKALPNSFKVLVFKMQ
jgi:YVTN family beta-propeller protein